MDGTTNDGTSEKKEDHTSVQVSEQCKSVVTEETTETVDSAGSGGKHL